MESCSSIDTSERFLQHKSIPGMRRGVIGSFGPEGYTVREEKRFSAESHPLSGYLEIKTSSEGQKSQIVLTE
jgi:hypothetical protein